MKFECLPLVEPLLRGLQAAAYHDATPIQQEAIPAALEGRDLIGCAQTGTGKTAAFALPTLQRLMASATTPARTSAQRNKRRPIRATILSPTRELAAQIGESFSTYGKFTPLRHTVIFGGVRQGPQVRALQSGVDILIATPGRLLDLIGQGFVKLSAVEILILDEADQMLDMGFIRDLRKIVASVPQQRQTLMFSATMSPEIRQLAAQWLRQPFQVQVTPVASTPERVTQAVYFVERSDKPATLTGFLQRMGQGKTLVFSRTKRGADKIARGLQRDGIRAVAIHGDKSQGKRQAVMREFNSNRPPVLVATDLAARGLDFSDVLHVINYDMPDAPETYIHRIGRTARAGAAGQAVSFCSRDERPRLRLVERLTGQAVPVRTLSATGDHPHPSAAKPSRTASDAKRSAQDPDSQQEAPAQGQSGEKPRPANRRARRNSTPRRNGASPAPGAKQRRFNRTSRDQTDEQPRLAGGR